MHRFPTPPLLAASMLAAALACGGGNSPETYDLEVASAESVPDRAADLSPAATAERDSVIEWAQEIRQGIASLAARVRADPEATRQRAVELYITRQERIEQTVGPGTGSPMALANAVHEAEARFHELMELLGETPPPDSTRVAASVAALDEGLAQVLEEVEASKPKESR